MILKRSSLRLASSILRSNLGPLPHPYKLNFCVTYQCQSRCLTCNIWKMRPKGELDLSEILRFASRNPYFSWINLTGGEPFLRRDLVEIAEIFQESCHPHILNMTTNSLCPPSRVRLMMERIVELGIPRVVIALSLDGPEEVHDHIRGIQGNYRGVVETAKNLHRHLHDELKIVFSYTMSRYNPMMLQETIEGLREELPWVTPSIFHLNVAQYSENYYRNEGGGFNPDPDVVEKEAEWLRTQNRGLSMFEILEHRFDRGAGSFARSHQPQVRSREMDATIFLDSTGNLYPSIMSNYRLGNIRECEYDLEKLPVLTVEHAKRLLEHGLMPAHHTSCEAYPAMLADLKGFLW